MDISIRSENLPGSTAVAAQVDCFPLSDASGAWTYDTEFTTLVSYICQHDWMAALPKFSGTEESKKRASKGARKAKPASRNSESVWTFLTNHSHVLICLAHQPDIRLREVAEKVGVTERAVQRIIADLEAGGVLSHKKEGRRNVYMIQHSRPLRHPIEMHKTVGDLLKLIS